MTPPSDDRITRLRDRIKDTQDAAARLAEEAAAARAEEHATGPGPGPAGDHERRVTEVHALVALLESLRDLIPDELREQFRELLRQVLLLVRALIDWWVERMETPSAPSGGPVVQDIPIV